MIAFFDSGFGGLSIFKEVEKLLPEYNYLYLGDQLRNPYGGRSPEAIVNFTREAVKFLREEGADLIIFACHTASSLALRTLQKEFAKDIKKNGWNILGVTIPLAEQAVIESKQRRVGVLGTRATICSNIFQTEIQKLNRKVNVYGQSAPLLVPMIEEGWLNKPETFRLMRYYLSPLKKANIDTLVLGCTHYPLLLKEFQRKAGKSIKVLNSGKIVAERLEMYLKKHTQIEQKCLKEGRRRFLTTDSPDKFADLGRLFYGKDLKNIEKVSLNS